MPYQRKDSPIWWASFTDTSGQRIRLSTGTTDRKEAEALESKWKLEVHQALKWGKVPSRSFDELMLRYVREVEKRSAERDQFSIRRLYPFFSGRAINQLSASDVRDYVNLRRSNGVTAATINKEVGLLRAAINYANKEWDWGLPNPASGRKLRESAGRMRWITQGQAGLLIRSAASEPKAPHLVDFIQLGLFSGMRKGEMLGLEWKRVDLSAGLIYLEANDQKNGKAGSIPLNRSARAAIVSRARFREEFCSASPWVFCDQAGNRIRSIRRSFVTACKRTGIDDFHPHDLRHTCAAWLVQAGVPIREVAELLRHSDIQITMRYAHLAPENVRAAAAVLDRFDGLESRFGHVAAQHHLKEVV